MMERCAVLAFMATVTCYMLSRVFLEAAGGSGSIAEVAVYGGTSAFGLEFLIGSWRSLWSGQLR
jgi:hypothetical protein